MAGLAREDTLIGRDRLIDAAVAVKPGGALHPIPQLGIRAARRLGAGLRLLTSTLFSVHLTTGFIRLNSARAPDCNRANARRKAFPPVSDIVRYVAETFHLFAVTFDDTARLIGTQYITPLFRFTDT